MLSQYYLSPYFIVICVLLYCHLSKHPKQQVHKTKDTKTSSHIILVQYLYIYKCIKQKTQKQVHTTHGSFSNKTFTYLHKLKERPSYVS